MPGQDTLYNRQETLELYTPNRVAVIGAGGTGTWCAIQAAMSGVKEIHLWESPTETLSKSNRARLPYPESWEGRPKSQCLKDFIDNIRYTDGCNVIIHEMLTSNTADLLNCFDIIFECADDPKVRDILYSLNINKNKIIACHYDGREIQVYKLHQFLDSETICEDIEVTGDGYSVVPSWVTPVLSATSRAVDIAMGKGWAYLGDMALGDIPVPLQRLHNCSKTCGHICNANCYIVKRYVKETEIVWSERIKTYRKTLDREEAQHLKDIDCLNKKNSELKLKITELKEKLVNLKEKCEERRNTNVQEEGIE